MRAFALAAVGGVVAAGHGVPDLEKLQPLVTACQGLNTLTNCTAAFTGVCRTEDGERFCGHEEDDHHHGDMHHHWMHHQMHEWMHEEKHSATRHEMRHGMHPEKHGQKNCTGRLLAKAFTAAFHTKGNFWEKVKSLGAVLFGPEPVGPVGRGQPGAGGEHGEWHQNVGSAPTGVAAWPQAMSLQAVGSAAAMPPAEHAWHHHGHEHMNEHGGHGHWRHEPNGFNGNRHGRPRHLGDCGAKKDGEKCTVAREGRCVPTGKCPVFQGQVVCKPWDAHPPEFITKPCEGKKEGDECKLPFGASKCEKRQYEELLVCRPLHSPAGLPPGVPPLGPHPHPQVLPPRPTPRQMPSIGGPSLGNLVMPLVDPVPPSVGPDGKPPSFGNMMMPLVDPVPPSVGPGGKPLSFGNMMMPLVDPVPPSVGPDGKPLMPAPSFGSASSGDVHMPLVLPVPPSVGPDGKVTSFGGPSLGSVHLPIVVPVPPSVGPDGKPLMQGPSFGGPSLGSVHLPLVVPVPPSVGPDGKPLLAAPGQGTVNVPLADPVPPQPAAPMPGQPPHFGRPFLGPLHGPPLPAGAPTPPHQQHHHPHFGLPAFSPLAGQQPLPHLGGMPTQVQPPQPAAPPPFAVNAQLPFFGMHMPRFAPPSVGPDGKPLLAGPVPAQPQPQAVALPFVLEQKQLPFVV